MNPQIYAVATSIAKSISQEQLRVKVRSVYSELAMKKKRKDVKKEQTRLATEAASASRPFLSLKRWQAPITLKETIIHESHDWFLTSPYPAATPDLTKLVPYNSIPASLQETLLRKFHHFFRASRYPAVTLDLTKRAGCKSMSARFWQFETYSSSRLAGK